MDLASMALSISAWKMQTFQTDLTMAITRKAMDTMAANGQSLIDLASSSAAPMSGIMDILV